MQKKSKKCTGSERAYADGRGMYKGEAASRGKRSVRSRIMRILLWLMGRHAPGFLTCIELQILLNVTAAAFGRKPEKIWFLPPEKAHGKYADLSVSCMNHAEISPETSRRIYRYAFALGVRIRKLTGFTEKTDLQSLVFFLYRNIGIAMSGSLPGEIAVIECFFSRRYTPRQCALMSRMDSGVVGGIFGERVKHGKLVFSQRLTEGCDVCRASLCGCCKSNCRKSSC